MSETKFTKGEWVRVISPNGCNHVKCDERRNAGYIIASTCGKDEIANAHLIAAAPEMYDFLSSLQLSVSEEIERDKILDKARGEHE